jgi:succinate dehydrogenase flavin-adding protein (antitoxin of CptAB toxin-antitoxin module)
MNYKDIPIEVIYQHIFPYLEFRTMYLMRGDNDISLSVYKERYSKESNLERALTALEFDDQEMLQDCVNEWKIHKNKQYKYMLDIFDIARNMRSISSIVTLLSYNGYRSIGYGRHISYDSEILQIMTNHSQLKRRITNHIVSKHIHKMDSTDISETVSEYIEKTVYSKYGLDIMESIFPKVCVCLALAIVLDLEDDIPKLTEMRDNLLHNAQNDMKVSSMGIFSSIKSLSMYDSSHSILLRSLFSVENYREYINSN